MMSRVNDGLIRGDWLTGVVVIVIAVLGWGCAIDGSKIPSPREERTSDGFVITESVRVGLGVRSDFDRAMRAFEEEDYQGAIDALLEVVEEAPHLASAQINLGIAYGYQGDLEAAESHFLAALRANPRHPVALNEMGMLYRRTGRFEDARRSYEAALELHPNFHFAHRNLGILCDLYLSDPACALAHYEKYVTAFPEDEMAGIWVADLRNRIQE